MAHQQAKALVWDWSAVHHWTVWVLHEKGVVEAWCSDCEHSEEFPLNRVNAIRGFAEAGGDIQIVLWVEIPKDDQEPDGVERVGCTAESGTGKAKKGHGRTSRASFN
jgi:hypothetical protein